MENKKELMKMIELYDKMIEEKVDQNAPDKIIGRLELKRQKLMEKYKKIDSTDVCDVQKSGDKEEENVQKSVKIETIEKLNKTIEIYEDMILKVTINNPNDKMLTVMKEKRDKLAAEVDRLVNQKEPEEKEYIPTAQEVLRKINELDIINDKLSQSRIGIRRVTKNLFKIVTSPDYIAGDMPIEINELLVLKKYKKRIEEQEQELLKSISKFFKAKINI